MKRLFILTILTCLLFSNNTANANLKNTSSNQTKIEKTTVSDTYSVIKFFKEYEYAINNYNHNIVKDAYASTYLSSDGFNKNILMQIVQDTWKSYPGIKYNVKVNSVNAYKNAVIADVTETAKGYAKTENGNVGEFTSTSQSVYYLQKENIKWQILNDYTIKENVYVWWGDAKYAQITLDVPPVLQAGDEYSAVLKLTKPNNIIAIGSITSDKITYPQKATEEIYRKFSLDGTIERIMKANIDNTNEYICATVGFSRPKIEDNQTLNIKLTGYACIMERLNVIPVNKFVEVNNETKK